MTIIQLYKNFKGHLSTINTHKKLVMHYCFKLGMYKQGILHDLSKYTPSEFIPGVLYFQGDKSPNHAQKEAEGYSSAWLHHKGRNKHHFEYWFDYPLQRDVGLSGMKMPTKYVIEMFCDRIAASRVYKGEDYTDSDPLEYYFRGAHRYVMHPDTKKLLYKLLYMLSVKGEEYTFAYIRHMRKS